jgi:WD40 repeat protein
MSVNSALACARFAPDDSEIAAVGFQSEVHLFGKAQRPGRPKVECDCTDLRSLAYRGDGKLLAVAGRNGHVHLFDRTTDSLLDAYGLHSGRIHDVHFVAGSNVIVSAGEDGTVVMFDTEARESVGRYPVSGGKLFSVCLLNRQFLAVAGSDNVIRILDVDQGEVVESIKDHRGSIAALACTRQLLFSGGYDATLRRFDLSGLLGGSERIAERPEPLDR